VGRLNTATSRDIVKAALGTLGRTLAAIKSGNSCQWEEIKAKNAK
jgi:hypothetical protein